MVQPRLAQAKGSIGLQTPYVYVYFFYCLLNFEPIESPEIRSGPLLHSAFMITRCYLAQTSAEIQTN
jgi:hypothetical protein